MGHETLWQIKSDHLDQSSITKHNKNHDNVRNTGPPLVPVHFEFTHLTATSVCVAGCLNHWQPEDKTMHPAGGGRWIKETVLPPRHHAVF